MAQEITIPGTNAPGKLRSPAGVVLLSVVTLSLYTIYWWYAINREMNDLGEARDNGELRHNPGLATLAWLGWLLIVPGVFTSWRTCGRIEEAQNVVRGSNAFARTLAFACLVTPFLVVTPFIGIYLMQANLNQAWEG